MPPQIPGKSLYSRLHRAPLAEAGADAGRIGGRVGHGDSTRPLWTKLDRSAMGEIDNSRAAPLAHIWGDRSEIIRRHSPQWPSGKDFIPPEAPRIIIPDSEHHIMIDQPLALVSALRALMAAWPRRGPRALSPGQSVVYPLRQYRTTCLELSQGDSRPWTRPSSEYHHGDQDAVGAGGSTYHGCSSTLTKWFSLVTSAVADSDALDMVLHGRRVRCGVDFGHRRSGSGHRVPQGQARLRKPRSADSKHDTRRRDQRSAQPARRVWRSPPTRRRS